MLKRMCFSNEEKLLLCKEIKSRWHVLCCRNNRYSFQQSKRDEWNMIAEALAAQGFPSRRSKEVKKKWTNMVQEAKRELARSKSAKKGESSSKPVSMFTNIVLEILERGRKSALGPKQKEPDVMVVLDKEGTGFGEIEIKTEDESIDVAEQTRTMCLGEKHHAQTEVSAPVAKVSKGTSTEISSRNDESQNLNILEAKMENVRKEAKKLELEMEFLKLKKYKIQLQIEKLQNELNIEGTYFRGNATHTYLSS